MWRGAAFGLQITSSYPIVGILEGPPPDSRPPVTLELEEPNRATSRWPRKGATRLVDERSPSGRSEMRIDQHDDVGFRVWMPDMGAHIVSRDGSCVWSAVSRRIPPWRWQRLLLGQVLPLVSSLRGLEVLHASGVSIGGRAIALIGPSGTGKTSLALELVRLGAGFLSDDVLALALRRQHVVAQPGPGLVSLRATERRLGHGPDAAVQLIGRGEKSVAALGPVAESAPLAIGYFPRRLEHAGEVSLERWGDPRRLLGNTFVGLVNTAERRIAQLDTCSAMSRTVGLFDVGVPRGVDVERLAEVLLRHASATIERQ